MSRDAAKLDVASLKKDTTACDSPQRPVKDLTLYL